MDSADIARANHAPREFQPQTPPRPGAGITGEDVSSPGSWSTAATPGTDDRTKSGIDFEYEPQGTPTKIGTGGSKLKNAWASDELETGTDGVDEGGIGINATSQKRTVRFTPSVIGGLTPPVTPGESEPSRPFVPVQPELHLSPISQSPPSGYGHYHYQTSPTSSSTNSPPRRNRVASLSTSPPHSAGVPFSPPAPSPPTHYQPSAPPLPYAAPVPMYASAPPPSPPRMPSPVPDLTPQLIAKAQKHCRFAISALDYEDADQARKELRAALAVLGG
jgi:vacuolar protein sorting-associated protein VTA1